MIYYGYKRGDDSKIVDWSSVSSDITKKLGEIEAKRAAQREKLEGEMAAAQQSINDIPMGNYEDINNFMLKFSNAAAEQMRINNALLRSGQMKPSEYTPFRQNVMDAAVSYKKIAENYNSMMDEFTLRQQEGKAGGLEAWQAGIVQDMADLSNTIPVIDPVTGKVFNAPLGADGKPDMKRAMSVRDMQNMAYQKYNRFDMEAQLNPIVDKYGKDVRVINKLGVKTKEDITARKDFEKSVDTAISQYDEEMLASVLVDYADKYKFTDDPSADPSEFIQLGRDGRLANRLLPTLTDDQKKEARAIIKEQLYMKLDYVETPAPTTSGKAPSSAQVKAGEARDKAVASINTLADWYGAKTPEDRKTAAAGLAASLGTNFISLVPSPDGKTATLTSIQEVNGKDTQVETDITMEGVSFDQFIKSFGKALTGQDLSQYYSDFVKSGRTVDFAPIDPKIKYAGGAYKKTFKQPPKDLSQKLADVGAWRTNVVKDIDDIKVSSGLFGVSDEDVNESLETAIRDNLFAAGISDYTVSRTGNNIKIKVDGLGEVSVAVGRKDTDKSKVKKILSDVYTRVSKGEMLDGSGKPEDSDQAP